MKRIYKDPNSKIVKEKITYIDGNSVNNKGLSELLCIEQMGFCAYTEEPLGRADARDIEHFNPTLKNKDNDNYSNWFLVKHRWNNEKSSKWVNFQPILHPTHEAFETRVIYDNGDYRVSKDDDIEAKNLVSLLNLDDATLADERKRYIKRKKSEIDSYGTDAITFFTDLIEDDIKAISYLRAIEEEFNIPIAEMLKAKLVKY